MGFLGEVKGLEWEIATFDSVVQSGSSVRGLDDYRRDCKTMDRYMPSDFASKPDSEQIVSHRFDVPAGLRYACLYLPRTVI